MAIDIDFGALQHANPFAAYSQGQEVGQKNRQQAARREAGNVFSTDPNRAAEILMGAGDYEAGLTLRKYSQQAAQDAARKSALGKYAAGDVKGAQSDALNAGDVETVNAINSMSDADRKRSRENNETLGGYAQSLLGEVQSGRMTPETVKAQILQDTPHLLQLGFTQEQIDGFDPSPQNLQMLVRKGMDLKTIFERFDKDRDHGLKREQFSETKRHNQAGETTARGQLGVAQSNVGISRSRLGLSREQHNARLAAGGYGTPGSGPNGVPDSDVDVD